MSDRKPTAFHFLIAVFYMAFILSASVTFVLNFRPLYYFDIAHLNIPEKSGFSEHEIRSNYDALIDYNSVFFKDDLEFPTLPMSENGHTHFVEVKRIFVCIQYLMAVSLFFCIVLTLVMRKKRDFRFLIYAGILTLGLPAILAILIMFNWNAVFVTFHHIFFRNDYWIFDAAADPVILMLPDSFFLHCALMILGCVVLGSCLCFYAGKKLTRDR